MNFNERVPFILKLIISLTATALYTPLLIRSLSYIIGLLHTSGVGLSLSNSQTVLLYLITGPLLLLLLVNGITSSLLIIIAIYVLTSMAVNVFDVKTFVIYVVIYLVLKLILHSLSLRSKLTFKVSKLTVGSLVFLITYLWIVYRILVFSNEVIRSFMLRWISTSTIEVREFYGVAIETVLGRLIFVSIVVGISSWIAMEIGKAFSMLFISPKSVKFEATKFLEDERRLLMLGLSPEERSIVWGAQLAVSILLYPFFLPLATFLWKSLLGSRVLTSKVYILLLMTLYFISLAVSRYLTKKLIRTSTEGYSRYSLMFKDLSLNRVPRIIALVVFLFFLISVVEGVNPLDVMLNALGVKVPYTDPFSGYVNYLNSIPHIINSYMNRVENLLEVLIKLFLGTP